MKPVISPNVLRVSVVVALIWLTCTVSVADQSRTYSVQPVPSWVRSFGVSGTPGPSSGGSSSTLVDDQQTRVGAKTVDRYSHYIKRVDNTSGLDDLSQLHFYFEPSYQTLTIHYVRIQRAGSLVDTLKTSEIKMVQSEDQLDQQLYNGTMAAVVFVNDLRVGDVVDYAYTVTGENPVLGGRYADRFLLGDIDPIREQYVRLLYPSSRTLAIKNMNTSVEPTKQSVGDETELFWYQKDLPDFTTDGAGPVWFDPYPSVVVSEFQTWSDVVNWALPYYRPVTIKNPELLSKIDFWKKSSDDTKKRAIAALRFVQDDIRYLGIELGRYSHQPNEPEKVFARRFGDCKDKSLLLSSIFKAMGIEAYPALVNSESRSTIDSMQATPFAFDHVIVNATIDGKTYWFDPTVSYQRGGLDQYYDPPFERGLVLNDNVKEFEKIPVPGINTRSVDVTETYARRDGLGGYLLKVNTEYRGEEADTMRYRLSRSSLGDLSKLFINNYAEANPLIAATASPAISDDQATNVIIVEEEYVMPELWRNGRHRFVADRIAAQLYKPRLMQRVTPLRLEPVSIHQRTVLDLGPGFDFPEDQDVVTSAELRFEYRLSREGNRMVMDYTLFSTADHVPAERVKQHLELIDTIQNLAYLDLSTNSQRGSNRGGGSSLFTWIGWLIFLPTIILFFVWLVRRQIAKRRVGQFIAIQKAMPGSSPETAIQYATSGQLETALINFTCRCGGHPYDPASPPKRERFMYDGQRLMGVHFQCGACKQHTDLYVNVLEDNQVAPGTLNLVKQSEQ